VIAKMEQERKHFDELGRVRHADTEQTRYSAQSRQQLFWHGLRWQTWHTWHHQAASKSSEGGKDGRVSQRPWEGGWQRST